MTTTPKQRRLHRCDKCFTEHKWFGKKKGGSFSHFITQERNQELSTLQSGLALRHLKRDSDSKRVVLHLLAPSQKTKRKITSCTGHNAHRREARRSSRSTNISLRVRRIVTLQQEVSRFPLTISNLQREQSYRNPFTAPTLFYFCYKC